jgi:hypothetical protein
MAIADNLTRVESRIAAAAARAGRSRSEITLVAVTKTRAPSEIDEAIRAGITDIGENRVQEALAKKPLVAGPACWHLVGSLQTNKAGKALDLFDVIHSLDSLHLAQELSRRAAARGRVARVLIEVNTSAEPTKHGVRPEHAVEFVGRVARLEQLAPVGLMTIGPGWAIEDPAASRPCFNLLRQLAEQARQRFGIPLPHLSMGMSSDFEVGIEEGATIIRVGTAIFGPRPA